MKTSGAAAKQSQAGAKSAASPAKSIKTKKQELGEGGARSNAKGTTESTMRRLDASKLMPTQYESERKPKGPEKKETPSHHTQRSKEEKGKGPAKPGETMEETSVVKQIDANKPPETPAPTTGELSKEAKEAAANAAALQANLLQIKIDYTITDKERAGFNMKEFIKKHFIAGAARQNYEVYEIHLILEKAMDAMKNSPILLELKCPVNICGDIHGQYGDLMRIFNAYIRSNSLVLAHRRLFSLGSVRREYELALVSRPAGPTTNKACGLPFKHRYLFLGDYVDRGRHSLEVIMLLLALRIQFPRKVYLLRGNHELSNINRVYGFNAEIRQRYRNLAESKALYDHFNEVFAQMPLAALVSGRILCMHGGLSPNLNSLDDIRKLQRPLRVVRGLAQDLLWADPETGTKGFQQNKIRAVSHIFGEEMVRDKCKQLNIDLVIRAHQVVEFGYAFFCGRSLITVFSAARYHEELVNYAAVVKVTAAPVDATLELSFVQLKPQEFEKVRRELEQKHEETGDPGEDAPIPSPGAPAQP
ncbi:Ser/Thr phosphatase family protein [Ancylostoma caninum]|uniref:Serine/threonine-protein phosphatase n=1 Tax=Ancylostoma caninum TaxID=29170 RepID=A0A368FB99_ANCCA|nr:Ser/Thr phosphatase family protein [Ancylostoma caninum]